jgi:hypothetical protein
MTRPSHLGGSRPITATPSTPLAEAVVIERYQDAQSRQWFLSVRLEGGRVIRGVRMLNRADGQRSGIRDRLPAEGAAGVIMYPSFKRQGQRVFWLGSYDNYVFGADSEDADESITINPDFSAEARTVDGGKTIRFPGGDTFYDGPEGKQPRVLNVRPTTFAKDQKLQTLDEAEKAADFQAPDRDYTYDGTRHLKRVGFTLRKKQGALRVDTGTGEIEVRAEQQTSDTTKRVFVRGQAGEFLEVRVDQVKPDPAKAYVQLDAANNSVEISHETTKGGNLLRMKDKETQLATDLFSVGRPQDALDFLSSAPPTQANLEMLARLLEALTADVRKAQIQLAMAPGLDPLLIPIATVLPPPIVPIKLQDVASRNIKAKLGGQK